MNSMLTHVYHPSVPWHPLAPLSPLAYTGPTAQPLKYRPEWWPVC
jgi:hypothetical protein